MPDEPAEPPSSVTAAGDQSAAVHATDGSQVTIDQSRALFRDSPVGPVQIGTVVQGDQTVYQTIAPRPAPTPEALAAAEALLSTLPLDTLPPLAPLPPPHRMPFRPNPHFVGRAADLRALARALAGAGGAAAIGPAAVSMGLGGIGKTNLATEMEARPVLRRGCGHVRRVASRAVIRARPTTTRAGFAYLIFSVLALDLVVASMFSS